MSMFDVEVTSPDLQQKKIDLLIHSYGHICRYCAEERFLRPIFEKHPDGIEGKVFNDERQRDMLLLTYMEYDHEREIGLPKYICVDCIDALLRWHRFQVRCAATTNLLLKGLAQMNKTIELSVEVEQEAEQQQSDSVDEQEVEDINSRSASSADEKMQSETSSGNLNKTIAPKPTSNVAPPSFVLDIQSSKIKATGRQCPVCGIFVKAKLKHHLMRHADCNGRPFKCEQCDKAYRFKRTLVVHVKHVHENLSFRCEVCCKQFCSKDVLRVHMKLHTNSEEQYRCETCGRCFKQLMYLRKHSSVHDAEPQFRCDHCGKAFRIKQQLKQHIRVHTGEKPHECPLCCKRFRSLNNLRQHSRSHAKEKPFSCAKCATAFSNRQSLTRHENYLKCSGEKIAVLVAIAN